MSSMTNSDPQRHSRRLRTALRLVRAFTLIEMLIAVGAVALIAVGLAKLFASTGQTIKVGRHISALGEASATLERQIRKDIASIANGGDGFLVIRNKNLFDSATPGSGILLSSEDRNANAVNPRRVDEIMFFANGSFTSAREPQYPGRAPIGSAARIYYGHGMRLPSYDDLVLEADPLWLETNPQRTWTPENALGHAGQNGAVGPNQFAGTWTLLRHVTVLARPQRTQTTDPSALDRNVPNYLRGEAWKDSPVQIGLQPAAASIFRIDPIRPAAPDILGYGYKEYFPPPPPNPLPPRGDPIAVRLTGPLATELARPGDPNSGRGHWPTFANGMVDVAAVDLNIIRARVMSVGADPEFLFRANPTLVGFLLPGDQYSGTTLPIRSQPTPPGAAALLSTDMFINTVHAQKMTMASAMPSNDPWLFGPTPATNPSIARPDQGVSGNQPSSYYEQRVIYADQPPDFTGNLSNTPSSPIGAAFPSGESYRRQDQAMLSASVITPGCTQFIVEWSFGDVYGADPSTTTNPGDGGIVWHGLSRRDGTPYGVAPYRAIPGSVGTFSIPSDAYSPPGVGRVVPAGLIHWPVQTTYTGAFPADEQIPLYSFFGYQDPSYSPTDTTRDPATIAWPWPRLLRITYTLTDPSDPAIEQTFQFVVQVPAQQRRPS